MLGLSGGMTLILSSGGSGSKCGDYEAEWEADDGKGGRGQKAKGETSTVAVTSRGAGNHAAVGELLKKKKKLTF